MSETPEGAPAPRAGKWRWLLIASLALNLLVIGALVGAGMKFARSGHDDRRPRGGGLPSLVRELPRDAREAVRAEFGEIQRGIRDEAGRQPGALRVRVADIVAAEPLDLDALSEILAEERSAISTLTDQGSTLYLEAVSSLSAEDRASYAERLRSRKGKWHKDNR